MTGTLALGSALPALQQGSEGSLGTIDWAVFGAIVVVMLVVDMLAHRGDKAESQKSAAVWTCIWIALGLAFTGFVWWELGAQQGKEYIAVYALEKSLSLDNLFVFYVIFHSLNIPNKYHHKVLYWGIIGALVFRFIFIFAGAAAVQTFDWITYVFGGILLIAAWRTYREDPTEEEESAIMDWLDENLPFSDEVHGGKFFAKENGERVATVLFAALIAIELSDILFAIDSVAAALSVTQNEFVIYSANIFAILGLRSLYLFLESTIKEFRYLHYGLAAVLAFAAFKLVAKGLVHVPPLLSVGIIVVIIAISIWASIRAGDDLDVDGESPAEAGDGQASPGDGRAEAGDGPGRVSVRP